MSEGYDTYCGLLRLYDEFSSEPDQAAPRFEYDCSDPSLQVLRRRYDLDRVAGQAGGNLEMLDRGILAEAMRGARARRRRH